jgi:hypothetical protein
MTATAHPSGHDYEVVIREMITREDELTNQRMLWMAAFNGLLFAALGFAWDKDGARFLAIMFAILGIASSFLIGLTLIFSSHAQRRLLGWWEANRPRDYNGPGVMGGVPPDKKSYALYFTPWILLASIFSIAWLLILAFALQSSR